MQKELNRNQTQKNEKNKYQCYKKTIPQQIILSVLENKDITKVTSHFQEVSFFRKNNFSQRPRF